MNLRIIRSIHVGIPSVHVGLSIASAILLLTTAACNRADSAIASKDAQAPVVAPPVAATSPIAQGALARMSAPQTPLSAMAQLGQKIFFDATLSASGKMSCASCHDPDFAHAPSNRLSVQFGGANMQLQGGRAVPSLRYHEHAPVFSIGPDLKPDADDKAAVQTALDTRLAIRMTAPAVAKASLQPATAAQELVPQGGFDWDGRARNFSDQAGGPLLAANEMANKDAAELVKKLKAAPYAKDMLLLFGPGVFTTPNLVLGEAYFALARYQTEERSFHPYDSKYDYYLAGKVRLSDEELRGLKLFEDAKKGNCATCHVDRPSRDGSLGPMFTDYQFEALAVPRNKEIEANRNPHYFDLGICGPFRKDMAAQQQYCGYFKTPGLRNVATRQAFFHNGVFRTLDEVLHFYVERDSNPEKWYARGADGKIVKYDDLPASNRKNVDITDAPFDRKAGESPALNDEEIKDVIAFLKTLNDGYQPEGNKTASR